MRNHAHMWVLRDLSNGDGAEPVVVYPKYVWAFRSRAAARSRAQLHRKVRKQFARLGPVEKWPAVTINNLYDYVTYGYFERKRRRHGRLWGF